MSLKDKLTGDQHGDFYDAYDVKTAVNKFKSLFPEDNEEDEYIINRINEIFGDFEK